MSLTPDQAPNRYRYGSGFLNVNQIAIGVDGTGSGVVFFDDIRLRP
ncbi:MAG: hypothetical protein V3T31_06710 [candidate division Zixibacteria bacterium]